MIKGLVMSGAALSTPVELRRGGDIVANGGQAEIVTLHNRGERVTPHSSQATVAAKIDFGRWSRVEVTVAAAFKLNILQSLKRASAHFEIGLCCTCTKCEKGSDRYSQHLSLCER